MLNSIDNHEISLSNSAKNHAQYFNVGVDNGRPSSALLRGIKITEFDEEKINPEPVTINEIDFYMGESLNPILLRNLTGFDDLTKVETLELKVDSKERSLGNFGEYLPNLKMLKLIHSCIPVVRDLGSCLKSLMVLHMCRCRVSDLDGLPMLVSLKELYLAYNDISDISSCGLLEHLVVLDLEGNSIADVSQLSFLGLCPKLTSLTLEGNPVCTNPRDIKETDYNYRMTVSNEITQLKNLDGEPVDTGNLIIDGTPKNFPMTSRKDETSISKANLLSLQEDWNMLYDLLEDATSDSNENQTSNYLNLNGRLTSRRPMTSQALIHRPGSSLKPSGFKLQRETDFSMRSSLIHNGSQNRGYDLNINAEQQPHLIDSSCASTPGTCTSIESGIFTASSLDLPASDDSSGIVFYGNLARAMRFRKQSSSLSKLLPKENNDIIHEPTTHEISECGLPVKQIFNQVEIDQNTLDVDLKVMKDEIKRSIEQIKSKKSPQVLKIYHDKVDEDDNDDAICLAEEGDDFDEVISQRKLHLQKVQNYKTEMDEKRESLNKFADYFIKMSSKPVNLRSKYFRRQDDLDKYFDKEPCHNNDLNGNKKNQRESQRINSLKEEAIFEERNCIRHQKVVANPLEIQASTSFSMSNSNKKGNHRLKPETRRMTKKEDDLLTKTATRAQKKPLISPPISNSTGLELTPMRSIDSRTSLHHNTIIKAASRFLNTGYLTNVNL